MHIIPIDDWVEHEFSIDCICGPVEEENDEQSGWMYVHEALDGRI